MPAKTHQRDCAGSSSSSSSRAGGAAGGGPMSAWPSPAGGGFASQAAISGLQKKPLAIPAAMAPGGIQRDPASAASLISDARRAHARYKNLESTVSNLQGAADDMREAGTHWYGDDDNLIAAARALTGAAGHISAAGGQLSSFTGTMKGTDFDGVTANLGKIETALEAADLFAEFMDRSALDAFTNDPTVENANAWADDVTDLFTRASNVFPDDIPGLPSFIPGMIKGYLRAPAAYVNAFQGIMAEYTARIDSTAGFSNSRAKVVLGGEAIWEGELSHVFFTASPDLRGFMKKYSDKDGVDLEECSKAGGLAHLLYLIGAYATYEQEEAFIPHVQRYQ